MQTSYSTCDSKCSKEEHRYHSVKAGRSKLIIRELLARKCSQTVTGCLGLYETGFASSMFHCLACHSTKPYGTRTSLGQVPVLEFMDFSNTRFKVDNDAPIGIEYAKPQHICCTSTLAYLGPLQIWQRVPLAAEHKSLALKEPICKQSCPRQLVSGFLSNVSLVRQTEVERLCFLPSNSIEDDGCMQKSNFQGK